MANYFTICTLMACVVMFLSYDVVRAKAVKNIDTPSSSSSAEMLAKIMDAIGSSNNDEENDFRSNENDDSDVDDSGEYYNKRGIPYNGGIYGKRASIPFSGGMYGKRGNVPFSGGMYGKRAGIPFSGGMYGKKSIPFSGGVYGKRSAAVPVHLGGKKSVPFSGGLYG